MGRTERPDGDADPASTTQRTRVAAYALTTDASGRVLLCRIAPQIAPGQLWTLPGGGVEFGESPERAVVRELMEETGLVGEIDRLADVSDRVFGLADEDTDIHEVRIVYRVRVTGGELRDEVDGSTDTCAWIDPATAAELHLGDLARRALAILRRGEDADD